MTHFPAKILLFGEHTVLIGGMALARPLSLFSGYWDFRQNDVDESLQEFGEYLFSVQRLNTILNLNSFRDEIQNGLTFISDIPIGYGLGSSGALVAAVMHRYASKSITEIEDFDFQQHLALMESFFHGKSSGFDPLIIFKETPVLVNGNQFDFSIQCIFPKDNHNLFLVDTGISRSTEPLVTSFLERTQQPKFTKELEFMLMPAIEEAISGMIKADFALTFSAMDKISRIQMELLLFLIHENSIEFWELGLESDYFKVKLCGAGGGGFLLGMTNDWDRLLTEFPEIDFIKLME